MQPQYVFATRVPELAVALKFFPKAKALLVDWSDDYYRAFMGHLDDLQEVYESLMDEESKRTFRGYWLGRCSGQLDKIVFAETPHYICAGFIPERGAVVVDGGVFDGGSSAVFAEMGYKVYGFEMDKANYEMAVTVAKEKNFVLENLGLGSYRHSVKYSPSGTSSTLDAKGSETAEIISLDAYVREKNLPRIDFIKLDVEGEELEILKGASATIARFKPILAISAYHKVDDFWVLMNFIKSIRPDYEFAMRQFARTPEEEPEFFRKAVTMKHLVTLGLKPEYRTFGECVLFAG